MLDTEESPLRKILADVYSFWSESKAKLRAFWSTRQTILTGEALWNLTPAQRSERGVYGPWKFNLAQSALCGTVAGVVSNSVAFVIGTAPEPVFLPGQEELGKLIVQVSAWVKPFLIPAALMVMAYAMAWGSLFAKDSTHASRSRAMSAYLYADGTYGLWPELVTATYLSLVANTALTKLFPMAMAIGNLIFLLVLAILSVPFLRKMPRMVFKANGYSTRTAHFWQRKRVGDPPWTKMTFAYAILVALVLNGLTLAVMLLVFLLANVLHWLKHLFV